MNVDKMLIKSQQTELDAVVMYQKLATRFPQEGDKFKSLAADEGRHAAVLAKLTGKTLRPRKGLANGVNVLVSLLGKKFMLGKIAAFEYKAYDTYEPLAEQFAEMQSVRGDERRHGDIVTSIRNGL